MIAQVVLLTTMAITRTTMAYLTIYLVRLTLCITCGPGWRGPGQAFNNVASLGSSIPGLGSPPRQGRDRPDRQVHALVRRWHRAAFASPKGAYSSS